MTIEAAIIPSGQSFSGRIDAISQICGSILPYPGCTYTNVVPTAQAVFSDEIYNGVGYKTDTRFDNSKEVSFEAGCEGYLLTGLIPYDSAAENQRTIYIKGAEIDTAADNCRCGLFDATKSYLAEIRQTRIEWADTFEITKLANGYYKLYRTADWSCEYICFSLLDIGEVPIIFFGNPSA